MKRFIGLLLLSVLVAGCKVSPVDLEFSIPIEPPIQEPLIQEPIEPLIQEPIEPPIQEPIEPPIQEPIEPPIQEPIEPPIQEPIEPRTQEITNTCTLPATWRYDKLGDICGCYTDWDGNSAPMIIVSLEGGLRVCGAPKIEQ